MKKLPLPISLNKNPKSNPFLASEKRRLKSLMKFEEKARQAGYFTIAGVDEAGRGPLAGPLVAAACILPISARFYGIDDSKKLAAEERERIYRQISEDKEVFFAVSFVSSEEIDRINIHQATLQAMQQAIATLAKPPDFLLIDGLKLPGITIPHEKIIKGDALSQSIAAASIIAKVTRDRMMKDLHQLWPQYGFNQHKGYGTAEHLKAIEKYGACPIHRKSFSPFKIPRLPTTPVLLN